MWGIYNVLINGGSTGQIVFDSDKIFDVYQTGRPTPPGITEWLDGNRQEVYPAFIDDHIHDRYDEPEKEDVEHLQAACIAGGIGTVITMPNGKTMETVFVHPDQLEYRAKQWKNTLLTVRHNICASKENLDIIAKLNKSLFPNLGNIKEYHASTNNPVVLLDDSISQRKSAEAAGKAGLIRNIHAEYEPWLKRNRQQIEAQRKVSIIDHCIIRDGETEVRGIIEDLQVVEDTMVETHYCHISTKRGIELIVDGKNRGLPVTLETCPHYFLLYDELLRVLGGHAKMNPALRSKLEMEWVGEYLCRGYIDMIATDHAPHPKKIADPDADYDQTPSGVPGVQTMGLIMYDLKHKGKITGQQFVDMTSLKAAQRFGFNKGRLAAGYDGDVVLIDPKVTTTFHNADMKSKCGWTQFDGMTVAGRITTVVLGGKIVLS